MPASGPGRCRTCSSRTARCAPPRARPARRGRSWRWPPGWPSGWPAGRPWTTTPARAPQPGPGRARGGGGERPSGLLPAVGGGHPLPEHLLHAAAGPVRAGGAVGVPEAVLARRHPPGPAVAAAVEEDIRRRGPQALDHAGRGGVLVAGGMPARPEEPRAGPALALHDRAVLDAHRRRVRRAGVRHRLLALPGPDQLVDLPRFGPRRRLVPAVPDPGHDRRAAVRAGPEARLLPGDL